MGLNECICKMNRKVVGSNPTYMPSIDNLRRDCLLGKPPHLGQKKSKMPKLEKHLIYDFVLLNYDQSRVSRTKT